MTVLRRYLLAGIAAASLALTPFARAGADDATDRVLITHCVGCDLHGRDFHGRDLHGAKFVGTDMRHVNLRDADLHGASFVGVDLTGAQLQGADLRDTRFTGTDFADAEPANTKVRGMQLTGVSLGRVRFNDTDTAAFLAKCTGCNLADADLHGANLHDVVMIGSDFRRAALQGANFRRASLLGVSFRDAILDRADFSEARVCTDGVTPGCIDLHGAAVVGADFRSARWCDRSGEQCRPVTADELRRYSRNPLAGALLP